MLCRPAKTVKLSVSLASSEYGSNNSKLGILLVPLVLYQAEQVFTAQSLVKSMKKWVHAEIAKPEDEESSSLPDSASIKGSDHNSSGESRWMMKVFQRFFDEMN